MNDVLRSEVDLGGCVLMRRSLGLLMLLPLVSWLWGFLVSNLLIFWPDIIYLGDAGVVVLILGVGRMITGVCFMVCICVGLWGYRKSMGGVSFVIMVWVGFGLMSFLCFQAVALYEVIMKWGEQSGIDLMVLTRGRGHITQSFESEYAMCFFAIGGMVLASQFSILYLRLSAKLGCRDMGKVRRWVIAIICVLVVLWVVGLRLQYTGSGHFLSKLADVFEYLVCFLCFGCALYYYCLLGDYLDGRRMVGDGLVWSEEQGVLSVGLKCVGCGYNLKGSARSGDCSECGFSVGRSCSDENIIFSDGGWRKRLTFGVLLIVIYPYINKCLIEFARNIYEVPAGKSIMTAPKHVFDLIGAIIIFGIMIYAWRLLKRPVEVEAAGRWGRIRDGLMWILPVLILSYAMWEYLTGQPRFGYMLDGSAVHAWFVLLPGLLLTCLYSFRFYCLAVKLQSGVLRRFGLVQFWIVSVVFMVVLGAVIWQSINGVNLLYGDFRGSTTAQNIMWNHMFIWLKSVYSNGLLFFVYGLFLAAGIYESLGYGARRRVVLGVDG